MARPIPADYAAFYQNYIAQIQGNSIQELIANYSTHFINVFNEIPESKADFTYADGKWTIKDVLQHMIDAERVFVYRALRIARKDTYDLPGFNENEFAVNAHAATRSFSALKEEFSLVRKSTDIFLLSLTEEDLALKGSANQHPVSVLAIAFIIFGHTKHHIQVIEERYF
jgi:uncharacterized damage-inducible protein DinB